MKQYLRFDLSPANPALIYYPGGITTNGGRGKEPDTYYKVVLPKAQHPDAKTKTVNHQVMFSANPESGTATLTANSKSLIQKYENGKIVGKPLQSLTIPFEALSVNLNNTTMERGGKTGFLFTRFNKSSNKYNIETCIGLNLHTQYSYTQYSLIHSMPIEKSQIPQDYTYKKQDISGAVAVVVGVVSLAGASLYSTATHPLHLCKETLSFFATAGFGGAEYKKLTDRIDKHAHKVYYGVTGTDGDERVPVKMESMYLGRSEAEKNQPPQQWHIDRPHNPSTQ